MARLLLSHINALVDYKYKNGIIQAGIPRDDFLKAYEQS